MVFIYVEARVPGAGGSGWVSEYSRGTWVLTRAQGSSMVPPLVVEFLPTVVGVDLGSSYLACSRL